MAVTIKDPAVAALVKEFAARTGLPQDQAIAYAIRLAEHKLGQGPEASYRDRRNARVARSVVEPTP